MNNTLQLKEIGIEDIEDILFRIEQSYGFKFRENELKDVGTFGELCDIILTKIQGDDANDCTTQQAFYKLQNAIASALQINKRNIQTSTDLQILFPKINRRKNIKLINSELGFKVKILRPKQWIATTLVLTLFISLVLFIISWKIALLGLILSIVGINLADRLGSEFDLQNIGQVAEKISREHYVKVRRNSSTVNRNEVIQKIKELFKKDLDLDEMILERETSLR